MRALRESCVSSEQLVLNVSEVAARLGLSTSHVYALVADGALPSVRLGRRVLVPVAALERLLAEPQQAGESQA